MKVLPKFLKEYFWDVDFKKVDPQKNRPYILKRILNFGNEKAVGWMYKNFKTTEIKNALSNFRGYSRKSANYWSLVLGIPKDKISCLKKRSLKDQRTFWPY